MTPSTKTKLKAPTSLDPKQAGGQGDYNSLGLDGKRSVPQGSQEESGQMYSHLNEGGEDSHHATNRERRREIIDGDYSHIQ